MTASREALVLTRADVAALMGPSDWLAAAEAGFRAAAEGRAEAPPPMHIDGRGGAFHAKGARMDAERRLVALKFNGNFPANPELGLPTIQGAILLCDGDNGTLLAIADSIEVTLRRTAAATALAARYLARPDSSTVLICGCGEQGAAQLAALREVLPLRRCLAWDREPTRAASLGEMADDLASAAAEADVIVTCTTAREPFLAAEFVAPGTFVAAVGADSPGKNEIHAGLMAAARVVTDSTDQCAVMGDLRHAMAAGAMRRNDVYAELAELVAGAKPGRSSDQEVTLFDSTGTAVQDVAAMAFIYEGATRRGGLPSIDLGGRA